MSRYALLLLTLLVGCATAGIPAGNAQKGYIVWGFLGQGPQTAAPGQEVVLVNEQGQAVQRAVSDGTGKYVLSYHPPGRYSLQVGQLAMPVVVGSADQRVDIDLTNPTGAMNYAQQPAPEPGQRQGQAGSSGDGSEPSAGDLDAPAPGSDCWASAGCDYDSSTGTYTLDE